MDPNPAGSAVAGPSQVIIPASSNQVKSNTAVPISSEPDSSNLVSPSFSPIVEDHASIAGPSNGPVRRMSHVLVPQSPWADREKARARRQKDMARSEAVLTASTRPVVVDPRETEAMQVSLSRLRERHCKWKSCGVVANSANNLCAHLSGHLEEQQTNMSLTCLWHQCGRQFRSGEEFKTHVDSHATSPLWCSFENCDESFRSARQLFAHNHKHANHRRRRSTAPRPLVSPPPFDSPAIMPSYMVEARAVVGRSISKARHEHIGPWVLQNIHAPIRISKYNAAKQPRRSGAHGDTSATGFDDYEFLGTTSTYSTNPSEPSKLRHLPDLNSTEVSQLAHDGLILWSPENKGEREGAEDADDDDDEWAQIEEASLDYMS
ncbi:hypothetical protein C8J56DRAFT_564474 [Mycena floridula]|nr:hypothetical protein C8J56DRAFT_564474 [Mycena floridula]